MEKPVVCASSPIANLIPFAARSFFPLTPLDVVVPLSGRVNFTSWNIGMTSPDVTFVSHGVLAVKSRNPFEPSKKLSEVRLSIHELSNPPNFVSSSLIASSLSVAVASVPPPYVGSCTDGLTSSTAIPA